MTSLSNRALLVSLSISQWSARKYDKKETMAVAAKHGIDGNIARVNKALLPMADSLDLIHKKTGAIRTDYYANSLPWGQEGVNVIKSDGYMDFVSMMRDHMSEWRALVSKFVGEYPRLREEARIMLNGLYRDDDYPDAEDIARRFAIDVKFMPVPNADDWRVSVADDELDELKAAVHKQVVESGAAAMKEAWKRVHELVSKTRERLADPDAIFRDTLVENAKELCRVLPMLNIADDPNLEATRSEIEGSLCKHTPETLRIAPDVRADVAKKMADLEAKMGAFYAS